ncbi:hypothetical protein [Rhodohalobacter barkolensis]|uniref:Uncharacterized protein n=1 Tax=Rhodohalobacter barkolensis TaxID=2053187 RepID=A0A2N0VES1_9BACT|nr:hypothetical protein [Rhodohalobacter barkolensis]PKD42687.1 hypothetical protein CWD77_14900 [Rhodohalobacter barkolensis]
MKTETFLMELESLCEKGGYTIRKERGAFRGDQCVIEGEKLIVINKNKPTESQAAILAKVLKSLNPDETYIKPAVRKELEKMWERLDRFSEEDITEEVQE